jgi:hypothetical protein
MRQSVFPLTILIAIAASLAGTKAAPVESLDQTASAAANRTEYDYGGEDITRPRRSVELRLQYRTTSSPTHDTEQVRTYLKIATKIELPGGWDLGLQGQFPFISKATTNVMTSAVDGEAGFGDAFAQTILSHAINSHWAYGFGARLVTPTAEDSLGTGKWQLMPGFGIRYSFSDLAPDTYFVPSVRYAFSFAGDPSRRNISEPQIAPTLNIGLSDRWFVSLFPSYDIRINFGDPVSGQVGRLFLPFDAAVGLKLSSAVTMTVEVSVPIIKDYPVYDLKTQMRMTAKF